MNHEKKIIVDCWSCGKPFDVVKAKRCYRHLNGLGFDPKRVMMVDRDEYQWTTKCSHCGACICHKYNKMQNIDCKVLNNVGIMRVMPSVKKQLLEKVE